MTEQVSLRHAIYEHYRRTLGLPRQKARRFQLDRVGEVLVMAFDDAPFAGAVTYATIGLSTHRFATSLGPRRAEFVCGFVDLPHDGVELIATACERFMHSGLVPNVGIVLGPAGKLFAGSEMDSIYVTAPGFYPGEFGDIPAAGQDSVQMWQIFPLHGAEARHARRMGPERFEALFNDTDLFDFDRAPMRIEPPA